jgi:hypothetical protein
MELTFPDLVDTTSAAVAAVESGLSRLGADGLVALVELTTRMCAQVQALHLAAVAELDAQGIAESVGALDTKTWLRTKLNVSPSAAARQVRLAVALSGPAIETGRALAAGDLLDEQAGVICEILNGLPSCATTEDYQFAQELLLKNAADLHAGNLRKLKRSLYDGIDPDGPEPKDPRKPSAAHMRDNHDGTETLTWTDTVDVMAMVRAVIAKHYARRRVSPMKPPARPGGGAPTPCARPSASRCAPGNYPSAAGNAPRSTSP